MASNSALNLEPGQCQVCQTRVGLKPCSSCKLVYYCCPAHRAQDQPDHKCACKIVVDAVTALFHEACKLRYGRDGNASPPLRFFEDDVGYFFEVPETQKYMIKRLELVEATLSNFKNIAAVEFSVDHLTDMLRLCRRDAPRGRDILSTLYLRLGRDQECYDFTKWWATTAHTYHWLTLSQPYLDIRGADVFEWTLSNDRYMNLSHAVCVTLIKVRILLDLRNMQNAARAFDGVLPQELIDMIRGQALISSALAPRREIIQGSVDTTAQLVQLVKFQIKSLFDTVRSCRREFWPAMVSYGEPGTKLQGPPFTEALRAFVNNYDAWRETPGAIAVIKDLLDAVLAGRC